MKVNSIVISGTIYGCEGEYKILKSVQDTGRENIIRVLGIPNTFKIGDFVTVEGELMCSHVGRSHTKLALGVKAKNVFKEIKENELCFSGIIYAKGCIRFTPFGKRILDLTVKIDERTFVPVIFWNSMAKDVDYFFDIGDEVIIKGFLQSREYFKVIDGQKSKRITTEVSAFSIWSVEK